MRDTHHQTDFILLPCDLLLSPANLSTPSISLAALLDRHRSDDNFLTTLFSERAAGNVIEARKDGQFSSQRAQRTQTF